MQKFSFINEKISKYFYNPNFKARREVRYLPASLSGIERQLQRPRRESRLLTISLLSYVLHIYLTSLPIFIVKCKQGSDLTFIWLWFSSWYKDPSVEIVGWYELHQPLSLKESRRRLSWSPGQKCFTSTLAAQTLKINFYRSQRDPRQECQTLDRNLRQTLLSLIVLRRTLRSGIHIICVFVSYSLMFPFNISKMLVIAATAKHSSSQTIPDNCVQTLEE